MFQESTIGIAFNIDRIGLHIGAGYRVTFGRLDRKRPDPLTDYLSIGAVYRNKITVGVSQNGGSALNNDFENTFGPPPSPEYYFTLGTGFNHDPWQVSFAYARGFASTYVDVDTSGFITECPNCGGPGQYALKANHFLFDFSYNWR